jgi:hypothetical protein
MNSTKCNRKRVLTQVERRVLNAFKEAFEDTGRDPAQLLPDEELIDVLFWLVYIIERSGWDIQARESWQRADRIYSEQFCDKPAGVA